MSEFHPSMCRTCGNFCAVQVETKAGRIVDVIGDKENPLFQGYICPKGRAHAKFYDHPDRLRGSLKRAQDGSYMPIPVNTAMDEIADRLKAIIDRHGPRSVAMFMGSYFLVDNPVNLSIGAAFMKALESQMVFSTATIDQGGKSIAKGLHGVWMAPGQAMHDPEVVLLIGTNPMVSHQGRIGRPGSLEKNLKTRGGQLIVIDPRRTEVAKRADLFLQPRPGEDVAILAGMIRIIIEEELYDRDFIAQNVNGLEQLRAAVQPFTPAYVANRADISADDLVRAARIFGTARRGYANAGTGPSMAAYGTLLEYLVLCLDTLCGHWLRAGERVKSALTLVPKAAQISKAQAQPPFPAFGFGEQLRVRGLANTLAGLPSGALADEILLPGEGQIKALISVGGNPLNALPDQLKTIAAFRSLELLVQTDVQMSSTARMADYVVGAKLPYEIAGTNLVIEFAGLYANGWGYEESYAQYTPPVVAPPAGSELIEQWELLYGLAQRMDLQLECYPGLGEHLAIGGPAILDMSSKPSTEELLDLVHTGSRVPLGELKRHPGGAFYPDPSAVVEPKDDGWEGRLDIGNETMMSDLAATVATGAEAVDPEFPFRLLSRRMMHVINSPTVTMSRQKHPYNPAFVHPADLDALGLKTGDLIEIRSSRAAVLAVVEADSSLRRSTVSMAASWGDAPAFDSDVRSIGSPAGRLIANDTVYDRYSGQPRMSNVPVRIARAEDRARVSAG